MDKSPKSLKRIVLFLFVLNFYDNSSASVVLVIIVIIYIALLLVFHVGYKCVDSVEVSAK